MTLAAATWERLAARCAAGLLLLAVTAYYVLASVPFAYYHFLQFAHFAWLPWFVRFHWVAMAAGTTLLVFTARGDASAGQGADASRWRVRLALLGGLPTIWMAIVAFVPALQTFTGALVLCFVPLALLMLAAALDLVRARAAVPRSSNGAHQSVFLRATTAGLVVSSLYLVGGGRALGRSADGPGLAVPALASAAGHVALFLLVIGGFALVSQIGARRAWSSFRSGLASAAWAALLIAVFLHRVVFSTLLMGQREALIIALAVGVAVSLYGLAIRVETALIQLEGNSEPARAAGRRHWIAASLSAAVLVMCVFVLPPRLLLADWGGVLQKSLAVAAWGAAFLLTQRLPARACVPVTVVAAALLAGSPLGMRSARSRTAAWPATLEDAELAVQQYATADPSVATLLELSRPVVTDREYFATLATAGDVTDRQGLPAVPLTVVPALDGVPAERPHIFVFVIDSLRPDYLGAYRPAAHALTPAFDRFASESVVMRRAVTPYAGTSLSQPAIWAGGLIPRVNYVKPFSVMNNLERLVLAAGYRRYVSLDEISRLTLDRQDEIQNLDPAIEHPERHEEMFTFDFCATLDQLTRYIDRDAADRRPIFAYTQPQNMHIRVLAEDAFPKYEGVRVGGEEFFKPAADAIRRLDGCFGTFIEGLKARGLYDDSIIVVTSDHGDSYGEGGRWGHAFYLVPEILRIPLLMHVPARLKSKWTWREDALVTSTGITPTLYQLLGYGYAPSSDLVGRPFVSNGAQPEAASDDALLVQSGYTRAYGLLAGDGSWLYAANANQVAEAYFGGTPGAAEPHPLSAPERVRLRARLLEQIRGLNGYYTSQKRQ